jgi:hypothetical protein
VNKEVEGITVAKHQKATDVWRQTTPAFGAKVSFAEAYPTIEEATLEVDETSMGIATPIRTHHRNSKGGGLNEFVNCSNSLCYNGGVRIGTILYQMVREKQTDFESGPIKCQGYEGSPKGKKRLRDCLNFFKVRVRIKYKPA